MLQHHEDAETALRGKLGSTASWDMAAAASPHPQTCQHNQTNTATPALPPSPPPTLPKLFKSSIRKCKKCTRTQNPGPTAPTGAAAGEAHLKRERDSPAAPAAACLPRRQHWHNFPTDLWRQRLMARGLSPRAAGRRGEGYPSAKSGPSPHANPSGTWEGLQEGSAPTSAAAARVRGHSQILALGGQRKMEPPFSPPPLHVPQQTEHREREAQPYLG